MSIVMATVCLALNTFSCTPMDVRVIDGDTLQVKSERIRLLGIDAPEVKGACPHETRMAQIAKDRVAEIISGNTITIERNGVDKYKRTLAVVTIEGQDIGDVLLTEGLARQWEKKWRPGIDDVWCSESN